jgi:hypothetical protein
MPTTGRKSLCLRTTLSEMAGERTAPTRRKAPYGLRRARQQAITANEAISHGPNWLSVGENST